jgi:hypothetical protein
LSTKPEQIEHLNRIERQGLWVRELAARATTSMDKLASDITRGVQWGSTLTKNADAQVKLPDALKELDELMEIGSNDYFLRPDIMHRAMKGDLG